MEKRTLDAQVADFFDLEASYRRRAQIKLGLQYPCWCGVMHHKPDQHGTETIKKILDTGLQNMAAEVHYAGNGRFAYSKTEVADAIGITIGLQQMYDEIIANFYRNDDEDILMFNKVLGYYKKMGWVINLDWLEGMMVVCDENGNLDIVRGKGADVHTLKPSAYKVGNETVILRNPMWDITKSKTFMFRCGTTAQGTLKGSLFSVKLEKLPDADIKGMVRRIMEHYKRDLQRVVDIKRIEERLRMHGAVRHHVRLFP